jgi:hypothetical protein
VRDVAQDQEVSWGEAVDEGALLSADGGGHLLDRP